LSDAIQQSLRRRRIGYVCHMTPCDRLPSIFQQAAILSLRERDARGIPSPDGEGTHYWGSADKQEALADFVVCSFMPAWWMCRRHDEELAMVVLDAASVCTMDGACFCPGNSAYNDFPAEGILRASGIEAFDACFQNPETYQASDAEIFAPSAIPLSAFRGLVFCDLDARDHWLPRIRKALDRAPSGTPSPGKISVAVGQWVHFRFPGDFSPTRRIRA
jgi:hypothetical protein